ncbi:two-component system response regulator RppA [Pleurocapsa sp. FMAR1]|uniref:two-component system response regulator RppA n=1 Tax=Pleurocapsa sp. FMAR1 TaxID=3040204 RepID=UPI0029C77527|nr:two-component system response regulator RppA [Pleurocapsa sp. FMAR1]
MRILLVEDEPDLGAAIKQSLNYSNHVVDWALDGLDAWEYLADERLEYHLGIFDWLLPGLSGVELIKRIRKQQKPLPILMLTARDRMEDKIAGLDAGADDYLVKPFDMPELLARLRALQRRTPQLQPRRLQVGKLSLNYGTNTFWLREESGEKQMLLTKKEFQLLEYFMQHPNQIVTSDQILEQLWEFGAEPPSNVVAAQISLLRRKLTKSGCNDLIETVYGLGYRFQHQR